MTLKPVTTFGRSKGITVIVITRNLEFISTCLKKIHSQSHWRKVTWPGQLIHIWVCCKKDVLTLLVCRRGPKFVRLMDRIHEVYFTERKTSSRISVVREAPHEDPSTYQTWFCGPRFGLACEKQLKRRRSKNGPWWNQSSTTLENWEVSDHWERKKEIGSFDGSGYAL